jgi:hypothetical protein
MMTSFAFILGLLPLVVATGASQLARRDVGTPVFGGMILASFVGIFVIPPLYVSFQAIREKLRPGARPHKMALADSPLPEQSGHEVLRNPAGNLRRQSNRWGPAPSMPKFILLGSCSVAGLKPIRSPQWSVMHESRRRLANSPWASVEGLPSSRAPARSARSR